MLTIENLSVKYGRQQVLNNINIKLEPCYVYGLIGVNGCGKTSILNSIAKFIDYAGDIKIDGVSTKKMSRLELAKKVSYMRQETHINFSYSIEEIIEMSRYAYGAGSVDESYITQIMKICELENIRKRNILSLSGGQRQRVFFAKTLAQDSELILIDEGFSNIDIYYQIRFMDYLHKLVAEKNKTVLVVLHDINFAMKSIDRVVVMSEGSLYRTGNPETVVCNEMMKDVFKVDIAISSNGIEYNFKKKVTEK